MNTKQLFYDENEIVYLSKIFKVLSMPSRLKILKVLFDGEKCVNEISECTGLLQSNISKQLKIMHLNKIVKYRSLKNNRYYRVIDQKIMMICDVVCKNLHQNSA